MKKKMQHRSLVHTAYAFSLFCLIACCLLVCHRTKERLPPSLNSDSMPPITSNCDAFRLVKPSSLILSGKVKYASLEVLYATEIMGLEEKDEFYMIDATSITDETLVKTTLWLTESELGQPISLCVYVSDQIEQEQRKCTSLLQRVCEQQVTAILAVGNTTNVETTTRKEEEEEGKEEEIDEDDETESTFGQSLLFSPLMVSPPRLIVHLAMIDEASAHHVFLLEMVANSIKSLQDMFASIRVVHTTHSSFDDITFRHFEDVVDTEAWVLEIAIVNDTQALYRFGQATGSYKPMDATAASLRAHLRSIVGLPRSSSSSSNSIESGDALLRHPSSSPKYTKSLLAWEVVWLQMAWTMQMRALAAERLDTTLTLLGEEPNIVVTSLVAQKLNTAHELLLLTSTCSQEEEHRIARSVQTSFLTCLDGLVLLNQIHADASLLPPLYFPWDQTAAIYFPYWVPLVIPSLRFLRGK